MDTESYKIIYSEMRASVSRQASEVETIRTAAARILGVGAIAMSIVRGLGPLGEVPDWAAWTSTILFLLGAFPAGKIWWPRNGWKFDIRASEAIHSFLQLEGKPDHDPVTGADVYSDRALQLEKDFDKNEDTLGDLRFWLRGLMGVVVLSMAILLIATI